VRAVALLAAALTVALLTIPLGHATTPSTTCMYAAGGALPDAKCTPGSTNPAVTQKTIRATICTSGYTTTIRPAEAVTEPEKYRSMAAYGWPKGTSARGFEYDHLVSLELGGAANDTRNMFPEQHDVDVNGLDEGSLVKDRLENRLNTLVCSKKPPLTLRQAQKQIATDWVAAYSTWVGPLPPYKAPVAS
jgi:hypothetical protein